MSWSLPIVRNRQPSVSRQKSGYAEFGEQLANDLQGLLDGLVTTGEFRTRHPIAGETEPLEISLCLVEHYLDDADIRRKDADYGAMQDAEMQKLISALRSGRLSDATEIHFLGRSI